MKLLFKCMSFALELMLLEIENEVNFVFLSIKASIVLCM